MKRLMPSTLITWLQNNPNRVKADCFVITLPTGAAIYATEGQWDITFPLGTPGWPGAQTTFNATQYGRWTRGRITSEASTKCTSNTMSLTCVPQPGTTYPGLGIGIINAALNHLFDAAIVQVFTAYMPLNGYGNVSMGVETKWYGEIVKSPNMARPILDFECGDPFYMLNMKVPSRLLQADCTWGFCDANCGLDPSNYTVDFTAAGSSTTRTLAPSVAFTQAAGYFTQGVVKCLTGRNAGLSQTVKSHVGGVLTTMVPWLLPVTSGDTFAVIKGCDKTIPTCAATLHTDGTPESNNYKTRFGGAPFAPAPSTVY